MMETSDDRSRPMNKARSSSPVLNENILSSITWRGERHSYKITKRISFNVTFLNTSVYFAKFIFSESEHYISLDCRAANI